MSVVLVLELELELELDEVDAVPDGDDDVEGREDLMANLSLDFPLPPNRRCLLLRFVVVAVPCFFELTLPMVFPFLNYFIACFFLFVTRLSVLPFYG